MIQGWKYLNTLGFKDAQCKVSKRMVHYDPFQFNFSSQVAQLLEFWEAELLEFREAELLEFWEAEFTIDKFRNALPLRRVTCDIKEDNFGGFWYVSFHPEAL